MPEVKYRYKCEDNYNPKYVNGALGGINPQGEITINFYLERISIPNSQTFSINQLGLGELKETDPADNETTIIRAIQNGVVFDYKTAKEIHTWLGEHIKTLENLGPIPNKI